MSAEEDYSSLPLEERLVHKVWKVRSAAYEEIDGRFSKTVSEKDPFFSSFLSSPQLFKKIVGDSNVVAQEKGIQAYLSFLQYCGVAATLKTRAQVLPLLIEKGLASSRAGTKSKTVEVLLLSIELDEPTPILEAMTPYLSHRLPKLVTGVSNAIFEIVKAFGGRTVNPKLILPFLPKLFGHADKKVRAEATNITIELHRWLGDALETILFDDLKPIQQKELIAQFEKAGNEPPKQERLLRSQQAQLDEIETQHNNNPQSDIQMVETESAQLDPYDLVDPVNVIAKLPSSLPQNLASAKWKERKEALEEIRPFFNELKYSQDDYSDFLKLMAKCIGKDVNLQVVQLASEITNGLAKGLRKYFRRFVPIVFRATLERTKERKPTVLEPLLELLDTLVNCSSVSDVLEETLDVLEKTKIPKLKEEVYKFLTKILKETETIPSAPEVDSLMKSCLKGSGDSQAPVRNAAHETIGVIMKLVGDRRLNQHLDGIDETRMKKIKEFCEAAQVKAKAGASAKPAAAANVKPKTASPSVNSSRPSSIINNSKTTIKPLTKKRTSLSGAKREASVPSKREASSPLKNGNGFKASRGLTSMVINNGSNLTNRLENVTPNNFGSMSTDETRELEALRAEKSQWQRQKQELVNTVELSKQEKQMLKNDLVLCETKYQQLLKESSEISLKLKSKDTQISRLIVDYEKSQQQLFEIQEKYELMKNQNQQRSRLSVPSSKFNSRPTNLTKRLSLPPRDVKPTNDLNIGVSKLTIEEKENGGRRSVRNSLDAGDNEEWKRANEVTINLKARIEKMKSRSRHI